ncbi:prepilin-type N-terminal cleavage/methylation domain-containing protein [Lignipirellula cremea]|uniref:Prepilin-type N-terminal cleavage/methylation domain-containing protein n=1 Tax=Lignipirellula cremea TaxID=2528010 RepID=A0A518DSI7_9BACT|nr:prepilin-type N-terminal cleavage/methylation domain-containing protein [Lignipirellula cremea]QDU94758.1 hypothetical protein Pla8534_25650 [Lignipirellula cremea]
MCPIKTNVNTVPAGSRSTTRPVGSLRRGLSLLELLLATAIMSLIALGVSAMAGTVRIAGEYAHSRSQAVQHGRVASNQIEQAVAHAKCCEAFPGCLAVDTYVSGVSYPDALVVWLPEGAAADPEAPRMNEMLLFTWHPNNPQVLVRIRNRSDSRNAPHASNLAQWRQEVASLRSSNAAERIEMTTLLFAAPAGTGSDRGAVRFQVRLLPSADEWTSYQAGSLAWEDLSWAQDIYSSRTGLRQIWCHFEMQLLVEDVPGEDSHVPFFGSAAIYTLLEK